jgi:hypothetical protein
VTTRGTLRAFPYAVLPSLREMKESPQACEHRCYLETWQEIVLVRAFVCEEYALVMP